MRVVPLHVRIILLPDFVERAFPQIEGVSQDIGLAAERQLFLLVPLARELESETETALDPAPGVDAFLHGDFVRRAFENKTAGAGVKSFVVFAHDHEIDVLGHLVLERAESFVVKFDGPQVDVLLQLEPQAQ